MFSLVQAVNEPTHGRGHTLDLVLHTATDNLVHSTRAGHDLTSDNTAILCRLAVQKPIQTVKFKSIHCLSKISMDDFSE